MISLQIVIILIFLGTLGLTVSGLYFFVATPMAKHKLKMRLTAMPASGTMAGDEGIMRRSVLSGIPALINKALSGISVIAKLEFFLQQAAVPMQAATFLSVAIGATIATALVTMTFNLASTTCLVA